MCGCFLNEITRAYLPSNGKIKLNKIKPGLLAIVKEGFLCTTFICYSWKIVEKWQSKSTASLSILDCSETPGKVSHWLLWTNNLPVSSVFICLCWAVCKERWIFQTYLNLSHVEVTVSLKYFLTDMNSNQAQMIFSLTENLNQKAKVTKLNPTNLLSSLCST